MIKINQPQKSIVELINYIGIKMLKGKKAEKSGKNSIATAITSLTVALFILVGCTYNEVLNPNGELAVLPAGAGNPISIPHDYSLAWNINNPYDSIGFLHNEALDYYITHRDINVLINTFDTMMLDFYQTTNSFFISNGAAISLDDFNNSINNFFHVLPLTTTSFMNYISQGYSTLLVNSIDTLFAIFNTNNVNTICIKIKQLENNVAISEMSANEKNLFCRKLYCKI